MGIGAEGILALQHDHDRAVGFVLVEDRTHALCRDDGLRVVGSHRHRPHLADLVKLWDDNVDYHDKGEPAEDDRHREYADEVRDLLSHRLFCYWEGVGAGLVRSRAHADFTKQNVRACTPSVNFSSLTSSSMVMRQPNW